MLGGIAGTATNILAGLPMSISNTLFKAGGGSAGVSRSKSRSVADTREYLNKAAEYCEQLCNNYEKRLLGGKSLGFWNTGIYLLSENRSTLFRGSGILRSIMAGEQTHWEPVRALNLGLRSERHDLYENYISRFKNPRFEMLQYGIEKEQVANMVHRAGVLKRIAIETGKTVNQFLEDFVKENPQKQQEHMNRIDQEPFDVDFDSIELAWHNYRSLNLGHPLGEMMAGVSTPMNTEELSIVANFPRREVNGLGIREAASFGSNCPSNSDVSNHLLLGNVVHKGHSNVEMPFFIDHNQLNKHGFICGVTGSGKTNTCFNILKGLEKINVPFLVIEPAKDEYRQLLQNVDNLYVFTLGKEDCSPFRINPFEFQRGIGLLTHIDMLKSVFNAAFPMYAAMPYLLEEAIYEVYLDKGWDLATSRNRYLQTDDCEKFFDYLPTLEDLIDKIDAVVESKQYAPEQSMNFSAALKARLQSFMVGSKGLMLNTRRSTPIHELLNNNVVLELKGIGDDDEKCFLMGLLLAMLYEYREANPTESGRLTHITLIEEAHRLLRNVPMHAGMEGANVRGKALETFTNIMSEIRQYGEGLLIVDQIPAKLTPDVIKNSNIKIVHRTLAKEDRDAVGEAMALSEKQSRELPLLDVGRIVVHLEGNEKPFLLSVPESKNGTKNIITEKILSENMKEFHKNHFYVFQRLPGFEKHPDIYRHFSSLDFRREYPEITGAVTAAATLWCLSNPVDDTDLRSKISRLIFRNTNTNDVLSHDCFFIWYVKRHIARLNEDFPNRYNFCRKAHTQIIDLWFGGRNGSDPVDRQSYIKVMNEIVGIGNDPRAPMVAWFVNSSASAREFSRMLNQSPKGKRFQQTDLFLNAKANEMIMGCELKKDDFNNLKILIFAEILKNNPYAETFIREYHRKLEI
jgi:hypothetical protein